MPGTVARLPALVESLVDGLPDFGIGDTSRSLNMGTQIGKHLCTREASQGAEIGHAEQRRM
jgi:hypothetical protein